MKAAAAPICNARVFGRSCLSMALTLHLDSLREGIQDSLQRPELGPEAAADLGFASCSFAKDIRVDGTLMGIGDVLWVDPDTCVEVICPVSAQLVHDQPPRLGFLVDALRFVEKAFKAVSTSF